MSGLARKVVTRRGKKYRGMYPSAKLKRMVEWQSFLERDAIALLEGSPGIITYQEQPRYVEFSDGVRVRKYYPDFQAVTEDGEIIDFEVKYVADLLQNEVREKFTAVSRRYVTMNEKLVILTEGVLRGAARIKDVGQLLSGDGGAGGIFGFSWEDAVGRVQS